MREKLKDTSRLIHIHQALNKIEEFMNGKNMNDLDGESVLFFAVVKNLEIIGEASNLLTEEFRRGHPEVPWRDLIKLRHVLVHGYYTINPRTVYEIITEDLPAIKVKIPRE